MQIISLVSCFVLLCAYNIDNNFNIKGTIFILRFVCLDLKFNLNLPIFIIGNTIYHFKLRKANFTARLPSSQDS